MAYTVVFYEHEDGDKPVEEFLDSLNKTQKGKVIRLIEILESLGHNTTLSILKPDSRKTQRAQDSAWERKDTAFILCGIG